MSTRAQIGFYAAENAPLTAPGTVYIYQHSDGSPPSLLPVLEPFARSFARHRGLQDTAYATARCVVALAHARAEERKSWQDRGAAWLDTARPDYVGLGVDATLHADIAYFYHVSPACIAVYSVSASGKVQPDFFLALSVSLALPAPQSHSVPEAT